MSTQDHSVIGTVTGRLGSTVEVDAFAGVVRLISYRTGEDSTDEVVTEFSAKQARDLMDALSKAQTLADQFNWNVCK